MRKIGVIIILILGIASTIVTLVDVASGRYLREIQNIRSLKYRSLYMIEDSMKIEKTHGRNAALEDQERFDIIGHLSSNGQYLKINASDPGFLDLSLTFQPLLKSKLSGDFFIKTDNQAYYKEIYRGLFFSLFLKCFFFVVIGLVIFLVIKYLKNRKYIL